MCSISTGRWLLPMVADSRSAEKSKLLAFMAVVAATQCPGLTMLFSAPPSLGVIRGSPISKSGLGFSRSFRCSSCSSSISRRFLAIGSSVKQLHAGSAEPNRPTTQAQSVSFANHGFISGIPAWGRIPTPARTVPTFAAPRGQRAEPSLVYGEPGIAKSILDRTMPSAVTKVTKDRFDSPSRTFCTPHPGVSTWKRPRYWRRSFRCTHPRMRSKQGNRLRQQ